MNTITAGVVPAGSAKPRVKIDDPASASAVVKLRPGDGHSASVNPARKMPSQAPSCPTRIAAAWVARIRSRRT